MRGRAMSRQASAEPITGPTRIARSRTMSLLPAAPAADVPDSTVASSRHILRAVMASSVRAGSGRVGSQAFWFPPSGFRLALWRLRCGFLLPLHELVEQLAGLALRRRRVGLGRGQKRLEFA